MWEIYTNGGGDFHRMIFTAIAQLFGSDDYIAALRLSALFGVIAFTISIAFMKAKSTLTWFVTIILVLGIVVTPKVDLVITDRVVPANSSVVSNVPFGIGATATVVSTFSDWLTRAFETVFSLPNEMEYHGNGLLFASHLVEQSTQFRMTDPRVSTNFTEFWKSCVYYDLSLGLYSWNQVVNTDDLLSFFKDNTSRSRSFTYESGTGGRSIVGCREGINNQLADDLDEEISSSTNINGVRLVPNTENRTAAVSKFASSLPVAYQYLTGISKSNSDLLGQNLLANSFREGLGSFASDADASAAAEHFAAARAERERMTTFAVMGKLAKKMLPIMHLIFEAFIYSVFPIVVVLLMLPVAGKVAMAYLKSLFWISMWPPLYAVLNFAMNYFGQQSASQSVVLDGGGFPTGLTIATNTALGSTLADYSTMAGYLSLSVPLIAWMLVSQSGAMMAGLAGRMLQSYDAPVSKASDEATSGNMNVGNTRFETHSAFQANAAPTDQRGGITDGDGVGNNTRIGGGGGTQMDVASSSTPFSVNYGSMAKSTASSNYSEAVSMEQASAARMIESNAAVRSATESVSSGVEKSSEGSTRFNSEESSTESDTFQRTERVMQEMAEKHGYSMEAVRAIEAQVYAQAEAGAGLGFADVKAGIKASAGVGAKDISKDEYNAVMATMTSEEYTNSLREDSKAATGGSAAFGTSISDDARDSLSSALTEQQQASRDYSAAQREVQQAQQMVAHAEEVSSAITAKGDDGFFNWMSENEGLSDNQIMDLVKESNEGDRMSRNILNGYAQEYVETELSSFYQDNATTGSLAANGSTSFDNNAQDVVGGAQRAIQSTTERAGGAVSENSEGYRSEVEDNRVVADRTTTQDGINKYVMNALTAMNAQDSPTMTPLEGRQEEVKENVGDKLERNAIDQEGRERLKEAGNL